VIPSSSSIDSASLLSSGLVTERLSTNTSLLDANSTQSKNYFDANSLTHLNDLSHSDNPEMKKAALQEIGNQFESILIKQMLDSMRQTTKNMFADSLFNPEQYGLDDSKSNGDKTYKAEDTASNNVSSAKQANNTMEQGLKRFEGIVQKYQQAESFSENTFDIDAAIKDNANFFNFYSGAKPKNREEFVFALAPLANQIANKIGVDPVEVLAQTALETGWGQKIIRSATGDNSFNLFGIKADARWSGDSVQVKTTEYFTDQPIQVNANFRRYDSYADSFDDFVAFLQSSDRYQDALASNGQGFYRFLQAAGYATDPNYANKIESLAIQIHSEFFKSNAKDYLPSS